MLQKVARLMALYADGQLGGDIMPEDANPGLDRGSAENYLFFTLPMALNYQRNSYTLWQSALSTYQDPGTRQIFSPRLVQTMPLELLAQLLTRYRLALQPNRQPVIWQTLCASLMELFDGDVRNLFVHCAYSAGRIKAFLLENKKRFPYLSGIKLSNYWLHVMQSYTDSTFKDRENISVAPDTHVIQASVKLGVVSPEQAAKSNAQSVVIDSWETLLCGTAYQPIDVHTPLWLWSRGKFSVPL